MNIPGFTADAALYQMSGHYYTIRHVNNRLFPTQMFGTIHLEATNEGINEEVINVTSPFDPGPDWSQILGGFGPRPGGVGWGPGESPGGGPGPHGGGGGSSVTYDGPHRNDLLKLGFTCSGGDVNTQTCHKCVTNRSTGVKTGICYDCDWNPIIQRGTGKCTTFYVCTNTYC
jgi:hypothetical protein